MAFRTRIVSREKKSGNSFAERVNRKERRKKNKKKKTRNRNRFMWFLLWKCSPDMALRWIYLVECDLQLLQIVFDLCWANIVIGSNTKRQTLLSLYASAWRQVNSSFNIWVDIFSFLLLTHLSCRLNDAEICLIIRRRRAWTSNEKILVSAVLAVGCSLHSR